MYCLEVIKSLNNRATRPSAVQSRDCSVCFSRGGAVIHSARHRDTVFIYGSAKRIIKKLRDLKDPRSGIYGPGGAAKQRSKLNAYIETLYSKYSA